MSDSPFRSWNDVPTTEFHPGVHLRAIGGEQVCLCKATYEPGKQVPLHSHEHTEQVMVILEGEVTMTIAGETKTLKEGDVVVVNRGIEHSLISEPGVTFLEALAPVPLDHIPDQASAISCSGPTAARSTSTSSARGSALTGSGRSHGMSGWVAVVVLALLAAVALQAATGFGFALLAGPSLYAVMSPAHAVALLLILGLCVNVLDPGRRAAPPGRRLARASSRRCWRRCRACRSGRCSCGSCRPMRCASRSGSSSARSWRTACSRRSPAAVRAPGRTTAVLAGFSAGVLTTSTTTNGPPLALWLGGRGLPPSVVRDTVSAAFLFLDLVGIGVVLAVVGPHRALAEAIWLPALVPVVLVGHVAGSWVFRRLPAHRYDQLLLLAVAAAGAVSIGTGLR